MLYPSMPATAMAVLLLAAPHAPALAQDEDVVGNALAGQELAQNLCAPCHALNDGQPSPNEAAPGFPNLALTYPPEHLAEGFAEGIVVGTDAHIAMPQFEMTPEQINDLIAYLDTVLPPPLPSAEDVGTDGMEAVPQ